jgi:hypothetical protein
MPEANAKPRAPFIALALFISAVVLFALSLVFYTGIVALPEDVRMTASLAVGLAAVADLVIGVVFFRKGQSS